MTKKEEWYFIRQDIVSYLMSTILCVAIYLFKEFSIQSFMYAIFDCFTFYLSFWYIRCKFDDTYHSNSWKHCRFWTRTMLCLGVIVLSISPIRYSLLNPFFVSTCCCEILYLVAIEVNIKRKMLKRNLLEMSDDEFVSYCKHKKLNQQDIMIADCLFRKQLKGEDLYTTIGYSKSQTIRIRKRLNKILKDDT